jgi:hypothetical protein
MSRSEKAGLEQNELEFTTSEALDVQKQAPKLKYPGKKTTAPTWGKTITQHVKYFVWLFRENPQFYKRFCDYGNEYQARNPGEAFGAALIFEVLRFHSSVRTDGDIYKFNNNARSTFAWLYKKQYPEAKIEIRNSWIKHLTDEERQPIIEAWEASKNDPNP